MKLAVEIGNPQSLKWELFTTLDLEPYSGVSAGRSTPPPTLPSFVVEHALGPYLLDVHGQDAAVLRVYYSETDNMVSLMLHQRGQLLARIMGPAFSVEGEGLSVTLQLPGTTVPINLVCQDEQRES